MLFWILAGLVLYYAGLFLPSVFLMPRIGVPAYMGSRDDDPAPTVVAARAARAHRNFAENLPVFLALGVLAIVVPGADVAGAVLGAQLFVIARLIYLPLYLMAVPWARSTVWTVGWVGLILMALALL